MSKGLGCGSSRQKETAGFQPQISCLGQCLRRLHPHTWRWPGWLGACTLFLLLRSFRLEGGAGWLAWLGWWADEGNWAEMARRWLLHSWQPAEDIGSLTGYYFGFLYSAVLLPVFSTWGLDFPYHRWISLLFGVVSIPLFYLALRRIGFGRKTRVSISLAFAFSTGQLFFSRIGRPDTMGQCLALGALVLASVPALAFWGGLLFGLVIFFVKTNYWIYGLGVLVFLWHEWRRLSWFCGGVLVIAVGWSIGFGLELRSQEAFLTYIAWFNQPHSLSENLLESLWSPLWRYDPLLVISWIVFLALGFQDGGVWRRIWWWSWLTVGCSLLGLRYLIPIRSLELYPLLAMSCGWLFQRYAGHRLPVWMILPFGYGLGSWGIAILRYLGGAVVIPPTLGWVWGGGGLLVLCLLLRLDSKYLLRASYCLPLALGWLSAFAPYSAAPQEVFRTWQAEHWDGQTTLFTELPAYALVFHDPQLQGGWYAYRPGWYYEERRCYYLQLVDRFSLDQKGFSLDRLDPFPTQQTTANTLFVWKDFRGIARFVVKVYTCADAVRLFPPEG